MRDVPCFCCSSSLRVPNPILCFRCTVCDTVNDVVAVQSETSGPVLSPAMMRSYAESLATRQMETSNFERLLADIFSRWDCVNGACSTIPSVSSTGIDNEGTSGSIPDNNVENGDDPLANKTYRDERYENTDANRPTAPVVAYNRQRNSSASSASSTLSFPNLPILQIHSQTPQLATNLDLVRELYQIICEVASSSHSLNIITTLLDAFLSLLKRPGRPLTSAHTIQFIMVILELPILNQGKFQGLDVSSRNMEVLMRCFGLISCLENNLHHVLVGWFATVYTDDYFQKRIELINTFISRHLAISPATSENYHTQWPIRAASRVMALFHAANFQRPLKSPIPRYPCINLLSLSVFYNISVDYVDLNRDFFRWQEATPGIFSFCQYPFLISLGSKIQILECDAKHQMTERFKAAFIRTALHGLVTDPFLSLNVRRSHLIHDSLVQLSQPDIDLKKRIRINFVDEDGVDAGGLTKEWFLLLVKDLFDPNFGMFTVEDESRLFWFSSDVPDFDAEFQQSFHLVGIILGLAIYNSILLDVRFPIACYKKILGYKVDLEDLKQLRPLVANGLEKLLEYEGDDFESVFCLDFEIEYSRFGEIIKRELIPHGGGIPVTKSNRQEYVSRYVDWVLNKSGERQFKSFKDGFMKVCGGNALTLFRPEEIEMMIRGGADLDLHGLKDVAIYEGLTKDSTFVLWLWDIIESWDMELKGKFLLFVTGSDRVPATGLETMIFKITCIGPDSANLPIAHTCFNQICLYMYSTREKLKEKLEKAITYSSGFTLK